METITYPPVLDQLGHIVREYRKKTNLTQQQLADKAQVERSYISRLENSHKTTKPFNPRIFTLVAIAAAIGIKLEITLKE